MGQFSTELLKTFIAPAIDEKPDANLPDLSEEFDQAEHWFANYCLNSAFTGQFPPAMKPFAESIIARIQFAFCSYQGARVATLSYAENWRVGAPGIPKYLIAVREWESVFVNLQIIYDLLAVCFGVSISGREDRTRKIANRIKHAAEDIEQGLLTGPGMPMWLTREGLSTIACSVTYDDMVGQVRILAMVANCLSVPSEAKARLAALDSSLAGDPNYAATP